ncbi:hypothetical protein ACTIVE_8031 [Actinomadura verrucosospora]|uniref:Uncharacterized protein n=1 Tax=Actinomadura verrucosospora TaxID=46165 RepID=A0A7D3W080_ACTVE|nr:hypothetical protein ACTIVE_8031 [Actinomadura verrucosospora]
MRTIMPAAPAPAYPLRSPDRASGQPGVMKPVS